MEKLKTIFQCEGFDDYYKSVLNGGKYVDPDCIDDINTPYYNFLTEFLKKRESESCYKNKFSFIPPRNAKLTTDDEKKLKDNDEYKIVVKQDDEALFRLTSDQFGFSGNEGIYQQTYGHLKYPLARINSLSKNESIDERNRILNKLINYVKNTRTLGGSFIWPTPKRGEGARKSIYNINRGVGSYLEDRVDLTLLEIKHALDGEYEEDLYSDDILYTLYRENTDGIRTWLDHFETFEKFIAYFMFDNFVENGIPINILTGKALCEEEVKTYKNRTCQIKKLNLNELLDMIERLESLIIKRTCLMEEYIQDYENAQKK
jgi:hypothetical protein